jgi:hypothetical protein
MHFYYLVVDEVVKDNHCADHQSGYQELKGIPVRMVKKSEKV